MLARAGQRGRVPSYAGSERAAGQRTRGPANVPGVQRADQPAAHRGHISQQRAVTARRPSSLSLRSAPALHTYHRPAKDTSRGRDIAASLGVTERSADGSVAGLAEAGHIVRQKDGRATATRSRHTCRCQNPPGGTAPPAKSWPSWPEPAPGRGRRRRTHLEPPPTRQDVTASRPSRRAPAGSAGTLTGCRPPGSAEPGQPRRRG
jgi:hypothetical protein